MKKTLAFLGALILGLVATLLSLALIAAQIHTMGIDIKVMP
jgi:hypothetical protein